MTMTMRFLVVFATAALSGCATLPPTSLDNPELLPERYGVVAVQVVTNKGRLSPTLDNWTSVYAVDVDNPESRYELQASARGLVRSRVFVGALPPGRYSLLFLQSFLSTGDASWWINAPIPRTLGVFEVDDATLTTLGTIVYQPLGTVGEGKERREAYAVVRVEDAQRLDGFVADLHPEFHARLNPELVLGWEPGIDAPATDTELASKVREAAYGVTPIQLADSRVAFGATLGQIYWREADGVWVRTDTGFVNQITTIAEFDEGYVAGGERGLVLVAPALEGPWERVDGPSDTQAVYWLHQHEDGSVYALTRSASRVNFFRVAADFSTWERLHSYEHPQGMFFTGAGQVHALAQPDGRIVIFGGGERRIYDPATARTTVTKADEHFMLARQPNGVLVSRPASWWSGVALPHLSMDGGDDWRRTLTARGYEYSVTGTGSLPYVLDDGRVLMVMHRAVAVDHLRRRPSDKLYTRIGDVKGAIERWGTPLEPGCDTLLPEISTDALLFLRCEDGRIMSSPDLGESWQVDRDRVLQPSQVPAVDKATQTL